MPVDLSKEINTAIKAALLAGKHLKKNKIELNKTSSSDPRDIKLDADAKPLDLQLQNLRSRLSYTQEYSLR